jgi:hypothetical protein
MSRPTNVKIALALCAALLLAAAFAETTRAQSPAAQPQSRPASPPPAARRRQPAETQGASAQAAANRAGRDDANADLSINARVTADSLRFEKVPNPRVEFDGRPARVTLWEAERENLPQEVRPGVTYRNIGITLRITSVFADIDRIVAEALGEIPTDFDTRPAPPAPDNPPAQNPPAGGTAARLTLPKRAGRAQ